MRRTPVFVVVLLWAGMVAAQNEWVLQPYLEVVGNERGERLGLYLNGLRDGRPNNPYDFAVGNRLTELGLYRVEAADDSLPDAVYAGTNVERGDLNGDGLTDYAVWKSVSWSKWDTVFVFLGRESGLDSIPTLVLPAPDGQFTWYGESMAIGDLNGDGFDDLAVTAQSADRGRGKVYVYLGGDELRSVADLVAVGDTVSAGLGWYCAIGDVNADGYADLVIDGFDQSAPATREEDRFIYLKIYLGSEHLNLERDLYLKGPPYSGGTQAVAAFDANGDGVDDVLWANRIAEEPYWAVKIFFGGVDFDLEPDFVITNPDTGSPKFVTHFGNAIANAGDMNGDGYDDILIGANRSGGSALPVGLVFVYSGGAALDNRFDAAVGRGNTGKFGTSLDGIGDINGDGYDDIVVGAPEYDFGSDQGFFGIYLGDPRIPTSVELPQRAGIPMNFELRKNYPNPFNNSTTMEFALPRTGRVVIRVFDVLGRHVKSVLDARHGPGSYRVFWNGRDESGRLVASGLYFYEMTVYEGGSRALFRETRKLVVMR